MRNHFLRASGVPSSGSSIITDNLVLHLDADNNSSYSGSGTTWSDLSGNSHDATLVNSPTFNNSGYFTFDSVNEYATISDHNDFLMGTGSFSEESWHKMTANETYWQGPLQRGNDSSWGGLWIYDNKPYPYHYSATGSAITDGDISTALGFDWVHHVAVTTNTGSSVQVKTYKNNTLIGTENVTVSNWQPAETSVSSPSNNVNIGGGNGSYPYKGDIAIIRIYKGKALTSSEITTNWNAEKARFGH